jgi:phenylacetate-CoA ligase
MTLVAPLVRRALLIPFDWIRELILPRYSLYLGFFGLCPPDFAMWLGRWRAIRAVEEASRRVPAYRQFLQARSVPSDIRALRVPFTDKENYIKSFPTEMRCLDGKLPLAEAAIDESSESTGTPYNWVRSLKERQYSHLFISHFVRYCFGSKPWITINAFSMGAWATGINMGIALQRNSLVKNTGPDLDKILDTLEFFGPKYRYLVCGYPPFLKQIIDAAMARGFPLKTYRLMGMLGGEGNSEGLRDYLLEYFQPVYSGYGATDLEIGIAGETPLSVAIRRRARHDEVLRSALFGAGSRLPMLFQYNPLTHHVVVGSEGELMFTISRLHVTSPRIMYNIHDEGGVCTFAQMEAKLRNGGLELRDLVRPSDPRPIRLPFLWIYGRSDSTLSVMGANIYPEDIEQCLYDEPELSAVTCSYCLSLLEGEDGSVRPCFSFEVTVSPEAQLLRTFEERIVKRLVALNADYRVAMAEQPQTATPVIQLFPQGAGPFGGDSSRIKQVRLLNTPQRVMPSE